jgi:biopolymer transport protein ExbD
MKVKKDLDRPIEINIVPMIDVTFAILTFFIMSTLFLTRSEGLPVNLPSAATTKTQQQTKLAVTIKPDGQLALNRQPIQLDQLETGVRALMKPDQPTVVVIHADTQVEHGQVVAVMDQVRKIEGVKLSIATKKP